MDNEEKESNIVDNKQQSETAKKKINLWKYAFLILFACILGLGVFLWTRISAPREDSSIFETTQSDSTSSFQVEMNKEQANKLISYYLNDFLKDSGIKYNFYLENQALLNGTFKLLGHDVSFYLYMEPTVIDNGNLQLKAKSISLGTLNLPTSTVLTYIKKQFELPEWVVVDADKEVMYLYLSEWEIQKDTRIGIDEINLVDDDILIDVYLPITDS